MTIPIYLPYFVFAGTAATLIAILYGLNRALANASWPAIERKRAFRFSAIVLIGWLAATIVLATLGVYHVEVTAIPTIQYGIVLPILVGIVLIWRSEAAKSILDAVPQPWLVGVQLYRALGVIFLILYAAGTLPGLFAWPAGVGDIAIGLLAPVVGFAYARAPSKAAGLITAWNVFGILDLVIAVTTGFMTAPSLLQPIEVQPTSDLMTVLPMVLIPVYLVPLSIVLHLASLAKLHRATVQVAGGKGVGRVSV
jgi:hypothetical protein